ncbi:Schizosaccharomyces specific protein Mug162 [Schizosaccharomyces osmophilus]|uniref:Schizosaccharomyces specific protein Mug162 n=1 Tax=Schizosaccharomyces osmophilus TaxID=2545709 RepID=A0AAE9WDS7_9SCHI|nr:Schizosaccharomyces specific protein Mug162 [Schizosaccharomyces osmophilus]WBW73371.1 Schizosaccharomyces specific protein Mug162 [Schizosaccharomyces osmophilus]
MKDDILTAARSKALNGLRFVLILDVLSFFLGSIGTSKLKVLQLAYPSSWSLSPKLWTPLRIVILVFDCLFTAGIANEYDDVLKAAFLLSSRLCISSFSEAAGTLFMKFQGSWVCALFFMISSLNSYTMIRSLHKMRNSWDLQVIIGLPTKIHFVYSLFQAIHYLEFSSSFLVELPFVFHLFSCVILLLFLGNLIGRNRDFFLGFCSAVFVFLCNSNSFMFKWPLLFYANTTLGLLLLLESIMYTMIEKDKLRGVSESEYLYDSDSE